MTWTKCPSPKPKDLIRWTEPLWAAPTKKRGKPDQIGTQQITAEVLSTNDGATLSVHEVEVLSIDEGAEGSGSSVTRGDTIRRKLESLQRGDCHKQKN
jgi:hypothetical protein